MLSSILESHSLRVFASARFKLRGEEDAEKPRLRMFLFELYGDDPRRLEAMWNWAESVEATGEQAYWVINHDAPIAGPARIFWEQCLRVKRELSSK
jgi:hypothetical protein